MTSKRESDRLIGEIAELTGLNDGGKKELVEVPKGLVIATVDIIRDPESNDHILAARIGQYVEDIDLSKIKFDSFNRIVHSHDAVDIRRQKRPIDDGPLVVIQTQQKGPFIIELNTSQLLWGLRSDAQKQIVASDLTPEALQIIHLRRGLRFSFSQQTEETEVNFIEPPILSKMMVCTSLRPIILKPDKSFSLEIDPGLKDLVRVAPDEMNSLARGTIEPDPFFRRITTMFYGRSLMVSDEHVQEFVDDRRVRYHKRLDTAWRLFQNNRAS